MTKMPLPKPRVLVVDLDQTLINTAPYLYLADFDNHDFRKFHSQAINAQPLEPLFSFVKRTGLEKVVATARSEIYRRETQAWLLKHGLDVRHMLMRKQGDNRPDHIIKQEMLIDILQYRRIERFYDDNINNVEMARAMGIQTTYVTHE